MTSKKKTEEVEIVKEEATIPVVTLSVEQAQALTEYIASKPLNESLPYFDILSTALNKAYGRT